MGRGECGFQLVLSCIVGSGFFYLYNTFSSVVKENLNPKLHSYANQNYNEISPHTGQDGHHQKVYKQ